MKFVEEFKAFALKGNVIDMAVGVIIGGAFGKIVSSVVANVIMPPIGCLVGGVDFTKLSITLKDAHEKNGEMVEAVKLNYGQFLQDVFDFLIIALCIFMMIKFITKLTTKKEEPKPEEPAAAPEPSAEEKLLTEIRDLLKNK